MSLAAWPTRASEQRLHTLELIEGDHWPVLPRIGLPVPHDDACVKRIREHLVDRTQRDRGTAAPTASYGAETPLLRRDLPDAARRISAGQHHLPHFAVEREPIGVIDDRF